MATSGLPKGWDVKVDPTCGLCYFIDHNTKTTQWKHPVTNKVYSPVCNSEGQTVTDSGGEFDIKSAVEVNFDEKYINGILSQARALQPQIDKYEGASDQIEYRMLMEKLEQLILNLDSIGLDGGESIKLKRKAAVKEIQQLIGMLEFRGEIFQMNNNNTDNDNTDKKLNES